MRRFQLHRDVDVSGVSGVGVVAEGCRFTTGHVVVNWLTGHRSIVVWDRLEDAIAVHGHGGATRLVWLDGENEFASRHGGT